MSLYFYMTDSSNMLIEIILCSLGLLFLAYQI